MSMQKNDRWQIVQRAIWMTAIAVSFIIALQPYRLYQSYIPLDDCDTFLGRIQHANKEKNTLVITQFDTETRRKVSMSLGEWRHDGKELKGKEVTLYQCQYNNLWPMYTHIEQGNTVLYQYQSKQAFEALSTKTRLVFSLAIMLLCYLSYLQRIQSGNRARQNNTHPCQ
ncbi:hypothetical protein [Enterovibrio coralii]|uniref:Uncharacterized protein n=1 Tax=Enterovibrio coralii TaxID=294935 RepID=A0A135I8A5_9GAMM|nr:hypothetical protein [Enterovibrio coralii]KXF81683.1 hypothetical protein ATN88_03230 [Enterovibrio coralii]